MKRTLATLLCFLIVPSTSDLRADSPSDDARTAGFLQTFRVAGGAFAAQPGGEANLGSTSSALRTLKYVGGTNEDPLGVIEFVRKCADPATGGFAPTPGGTPSVGVTASGLMALAELRLESDPLVEKAVEYLSKNAKAFEEVRIAVAGLEAVKKTSPMFAEWSKAILAERSADGTFGSGPGQARQTGGAAVAMLRMGVTLDKTDEIVEFLRKAQRPDGGWSRDGDKSDLETSYRIMRFFFMTKRKPDLDRLRAYLAAYRAEGGGFAQPGKPADLGTTYFCSIMTRWSRQLDGLPAVVETAGFQPLFNGKDLDGWDGDTTLWKVRDGEIVGESPGIKRNEFLSTDASYRDFVLKFSFKITGDPNRNSGVQFRSVRVPNSSEMSGYQADIGQGYWGCLYDESRRNKVLVQARDVDKIARPDEWNTYVIRVMGDHITLTLNGMNTVDYRETDAEIARDGKIALQIHAGGPMNVRFRDLMIQPLPSPAADDATTPGFHLRTVKAADGERKYTVFVPNGYDGTKPFPVVLFLHGSGERGDDGVLSAQVGLGPAIAGNPSAYPFIAVFPQARRTWQAGTPDADAALAALDDVTKTFKTDPERVILSGLSMGGMGSWSNGSAHPDRWSCVVPVCGAGSTEAVKALRGVPVWSVCGDDDNMRLLVGGRELVRTLREAGASPRYQEYRGVGHNSWDRAYGDPAIVKWMLEQKRTPKL